MTPKPHLTHRAELEGTDGFNLHDLLDDLAKQAIPTSISAPTVKQSVSKSFTDNRSRHDPPLTSHPPPIDLQYLSQPRPHGTGYVLTSPHRKHRNRPSTDRIYASGRFSKNALLVEVLGTMNPPGNTNFNSKKRPVYHLEIDLFRPAITIPHHETRPKRARRLLDGVIDDHHSSAEPRLMEFPSQDLAPLTLFRQLRYLKIEGMMQNYQINIWQCVWLNPHLHTLILSISSHDKGTLHSDEICIARLFSSFHPSGHAICQGHTRLLMPEKVSLARLSLTNFAVDAEPFRWLDCGKLKQIELYDCADDWLTLKEEDWKDTRVFGSVDGVRTDLSSRYLVPSLGKGVEE